MNFVFCVLNNVFSENKDDLTIFFTRSGIDYLDFSIKLHEDYDNILKIMQKNDYMEVNDLTFEYVGKKSQKKEDRELIISILIANNFDYNYDFEKTMISDMKEIVNSIGPKAMENIEKAFKESLEDKKILKKPSRRRKNNTNIIPTYGQKIDLSFFLVTDFHFGDNEVSHIDLNGGFDLQKVTPKSYRNIIKIITEKFERFAINNDEFDVLHFRSLKSKGEILQEVGFLYEVVVDFFKFKPNQRKNSFFAKELHYFDIFDIRERINLDERIVVSFDVTDYSNIMMLSENIANEKWTQENKNIDFEEVESSSLELLTRLDIKMKNYAKDEEFMKAAQIKSDIKKINEKMSNYKKNPIVGKISANDFHNIFNLK
jgi:hypothetical protein